MKWWFANDRCRMLTVLGLCLGADISAGLAADPCAQENKTTVCRSQGRTIRVIAGTASPSGRYAIGWIVPAAAAKELERNAEDGSLVLPGGEPENVMLGLHDGAVIATMQSTHFGDHARYNHREITAIWANDERLLATWANDKWDTLAAEIFRLDGSDKLIDRGDVLALVRRIGKERLSHRKGIDDADLYEFRILRERLRGADKIDITTALEIPGSGDGFTFKTTVKLFGKPGARRLQVIHVGEFKK